MKKFNSAMDSELLSNGFAYYDDWKYGPYTGWSGQGYYVLKLMRHSFGYWLIIQRHYAGGENSTLNIGSSNDAEKIIAVRDALQKLW